MDSGFYDIKKNIEIYAVGHFSTRGNLEAGLFEWGLFVDGQYADEFYGDRVLKNRGGKGLEFYHEIKPFFPDNYLRKISPPSSIPGGTWAMQLHLNDFKKPEEVLQILKRYFPLTFKE